ncbi:MAG: DUF2207 domain-containing protein [Lachnospiraceae bacterium]|nr:DUF2207 domain-containing protein [Lachnospiraceae bacterium]
MTGKRFYKRRMGILAAVLLAAALLAGSPAFARPVFASPASGTAATETASGTSGAAAAEASVSDASGREQYDDSAPYDFITKRFDVEAAADSNHTVHYREVIDIDFVSGHHGITRYLPENHDEYKIRNLSCEGEPYRISHENGNCAIRIGDGDSLVTGEKEYVVTYDLVYRKDSSGTEDTLSLDLLPTGWDTSIREASVQLTMPEEVDPDAYRFYYGAYGESGLPEEDACQVSSDGRTVTARLSNLKKGYGLTVYAPLAEGYWVNAPTWPMYRQIWSAAAVLMGGIAILLYYLFGRDPKIVETVEFYPPDRMTPAEIGYVIDGAVDDGDMGAMMLYFASKGYLKIREYKKKKFELIRLSSVDGSEKPFAAALFEGLFKGARENAAGETAVRMDSLPEELYTAIGGAKSSLQDYFAEHRVYRRASLAMRYVCFLLGCVLYGGTMLLNPRSAIGSVFLVELLLVIGTALLYDGCDRRRSSGKGKTAARLIAGSALDVLATAGIFMKIGRVSAGFAVIAAAILFCGIFMPARTKEGAALYGKVLGFRNFIRDAEYEKMKELSDQDPEYFYTIMPYAYVLGMETQFAKKFAEIHLKNPDWYESDFAGSFWFTPIWYGSMIHSMSHSFASAAAHPIDSGGGGFFGGGSAGGGFSGGGGGGGGGGAW